MDIVKINKIKSSKPIALLDIIIAVVMAALIILLLAYSLSTQKTGTQIEIRIKNVLYGTYDLNTDQTIAVPVGDPNDGIIVIVEIKDGYVEVPNSLTPQGIYYFDSKKINKSPQQLIFLPHQLVITVVGGDPSDLDPGDIIVG